MFTRLFSELAIDDPLPTKAYFADQMAPWVVVAEHEGEPAAYAYLQTYGETAHVVQVVVDPRARGRGVGRALMAAVRERAVREGCTRWYLNVKRGNDSAIALYKNMGLKLEHESIALRLPFARIGEIEGAKGITTFVPNEEEDEAISAALGVPKERIRRLRAKPGHVLLCLREGDKPVAFAAFDVPFPRAYPFRTQTAAFARPLLDALRNHARTDYVHLCVEGDPDLAQALVAIGARVTVELVQMSANLEDSK
jgi:GNAT superfamily N-acetyltransferase